MSIFIQRCVVGVLVVCCTLGQAIAQPSQSQPAFAHESSDLKPDKAVKWGKLPNGMRYAIAHNAQPKGRASLRFGVLAGSLDETEAQRGLAHYLEHLAFNGSEHFPSGSLIEHFQRLGMSFGGDTNAGTDLDRTVYLLELPDTSEKNFDFAFTLFKDFAGGLLLSPKSIEKERGIILSEFRDIDSNGYRAGQAQGAFVAPRARFTQRDPIGLASVIKTAQRDQFVDFYNAWYRPENFVVVAVGDFDTATVEAQLVAQFSSLAARAPARPRAGVGEVENPTAPQAKFHLQPDAASLTISVEKISSHTPPPDSLAKRVADLPLQLAVAMVNRRFATLAQEEGQAITGGRVRVDDQFDFLRSVGVDVACSQTKLWRDCLSTGQAQLRLAVEQGFDASELSEVIANWNNAIDQQATTASTRSSGQLASGLVDSVIDRQVFTSPADTAAVMKPILAKITPDQCAQALAQVWSNPTSPFIFMTGNQAVSEPEILLAYQQALTTPLAQRRVASVSKFAYADLPSAGKVVSRKMLKDLGVTEVQFANGVRLNLKPTKFQDNQVLLNVRLGGGVLSAPPDKVGLPLLVSSTFSNAGLGKHTDEQLQSMFAGKSVGFNLGVGSDAFEMGANTTSADLLLQLQVIRAFLTDPGYRPETLRLYRLGIEQSYARASQVLTVPQSQLIPRLLTNGDNRFGLPDTAEPLLARNFEEAKAWLTPEFNHGALEVAVVGDFDLDQVVDYVARTFGSLPRRQIKPTYEKQRQVSLPASPVSREFRVDTDIQQALVSVYWPATDSRDIGLVRKINLLSNILDDRLRLRLREAMGQTYSPRASDQLSDTFRDYGYIVANASVAPEHAQAVATAIREIAIDLSKSGVSEDELLRAKEPVLAHLGNSDRDNGYWLQQIAALQEFPERADWHRTRRASIQSISAADLTLLARKYLDPYKASVFLILPKQK